jgi:hypothetical protein
LGELSGPDHWAPPMSEFVKITREDEFGPRKGKKPWPFRVR